LRPSMSISSIVVTCSCWIHVTSVLGELMLYMMLRHVVILLVLQLSTTLGHVVWLLVLVLNQMLGHVVWHLFLRFLL
jgi:hypothetical protein